MIISILIILSCFLLFFFSIRSLCFSIVQYLMSRKEYEKLKKEMSFKEWFTLSRFRLEIPRYHILFYYFIILLYSIIALSAISAGIMGYHKYLIQIRIYVLLFSIIAPFSYTAFFEGGVYSGWTRIYRPDKIRLRGVDKNAYIKKKEGLKTNIHTKEK